jgi:hypothetical protein
MTLLQIRKEIAELKNSIITQYEPLCKVFILGGKDSPVEAEIEAYSQAHPHTHVLKLIRKSCRKS